MNLDVFGRDFILGNFRASDYGLILATFENNGVSDNNIGMSTDTSEVFVGTNPIPIYSGDRHNEKLRPTITLCRNPSVFSGDKMYFSQKECRMILRLISGIKGYQWMKVCDKYDEDDIWYKAKINQITYKVISGRIAGIILEMECDSFYGYSTENHIMINAQANTSFYIFNNTDDLLNYVYPIVYITPVSDCELQLTNKTENWISEISNVKQNEKISIDSKNEIITSSSTSHNLLMNDFNLQWIRLLPDKNEYTVNVNAMIEFVFRVPRKVGFA